MDPEVKCLQRYPLKLDSGLRKQTILDYYPLATKVIAQGSGVILRIKWTEVLF